MVLSFNQLRKRDVVNVADGRCFGKITDLSIEFPKGVMTGITVPARKRKWFLRCFDKNTLFISEKNILKIGGDVILVDLRCGDTCETSVNLNKPQKPDLPSPPPCRPDPCRPNACDPCRPDGYIDPCAPPCAPCPPKNSFGAAGGTDRIDLSDY